MMSSFCSLPLLRSWYCPLSVSLCVLLVVVGTAEARSAASLTSGSDGSGEEAYPAGLYDSDDRDRFRDQVKREVIATRT